MSETRSEGGKPQRKIPIGRDFGFSGATALRGEPAGGIRFAVVSPSASCRVTKRAEGCVIFVGSTEVTALRRVAAKEDGWAGSFCSP